MKVLYGTISNLIDVTDICINNLIKNNILTIPSNDIDRSNIFGDPAIGLSKKIYIIEEDDVLECNDKINIKIHLKDCSFKLALIKENIIIKRKYLDIVNLNDNFHEIICKYLKGDEKVVELEGNFGLNSLIIGSLIKNYNFLVLEKDPQLVKELIYHRNLNNMEFDIKNLNIFDLELINLVESFEPFIFDTLIICSDNFNFFYYLLNIPNIDLILKNIKLIIVKNLTTCKSKSIYIENKLENNFNLDYFNNDESIYCYRIRD